MKTTAKGLMIAALLILLITGCTTTGNVPGPAEGTTLDTSSDLTAVKGSGVLKIGVLPGEPVFYQENKKQEEEGEWSGFGAELAYGFAQTMGLQPEFVETSLEEAPELLKEKKIDCLWGRGLTGETASGKMLCTRPYLKNKLAIVVHFKNKDRERCTNRDKLTKMREFVVVAGSKGEEKARELGANYSTEPDIVHCLLRVAAGTASCALVDVLDSTSMVGDGTEYENLVYTVTFDLEDYCVGFRDQSDILPELEQYFADVYEDGSMNTIAKKYRISKMICKVEPILEEEKPEEATTDKLNNKTPEDKTGEKKTDNKDTTTEEKKTDTTEVKDSSQEQKR